MRGCGLIGCGTVGTGVVRLWAEPGHAPPAPLLAVAVRDVRRARGVDLAGVALGDDAWRVVRDPRIGVVVEATGDTGLALALARSAFEHGKSFVTAGKALVAEHGAALAALAAARGVWFGYEAAAGGALPIVALLRHGLAPGRVDGFTAVLNGTCNFVLSRLAEGVGFEAALALARQRGFAEADPSRDISGRDSADKLIILARLLGVALDAEALRVRGIEGSTAAAVSFGRARGLTLRLLAAFEQTASGVHAGVAPAFVPERSLLALARDEENAIVLDAGAVGRVGLIGRGAGGAPTAAAVLADVREALGGVAPRRVTPLRSVTPVADTTPRRHYLAWQGAPPPGVPLECAETSPGGLGQGLTPRLPAASLRAAQARLSGPLSWIAVHDDD